MMEFIIVAMLAPFVITMAKTLHIMLNVADKYLSDEVFVYWVVVNSLFVGSGLGALLAYTCLLIHI